jgi:hypothetical protein
MLPKKNWIEKNYPSIVNKLNKLAVISPIVTLIGTLFWIVPGLTTTTSFIDYLIYIFGTLGGLILVTSFFAIPAVYLQAKYQPKKVPLTLSAVQTLTEQTGKEERIMIADWLQDVSTAKTSLAAPSCFASFLQKASFYMLETPEKIKKNHPQESLSSISTIHPL